MVQRELLEKADAEMENQPVMGNKEFIQALLDLPETEENDDTILNPIPIDPKGSGRKRLKNAYEEASTKKQKQTRACTKCRENGHNSRTCEKKKIDIRRIRFIKIFMDYLLFGYFVPT
jgi:hypothetical protein